MINDFMVKFFGQNWRTTFWGFFSGVMAFIAFYPGMLDPLPDYWEHLVKQFIAFSVAGGVFKMGLSSRDRVVSEEANKELREDVKQEIKKAKYDKF